MNWWVASSVVCSGALAYTLISWERLRIIRCNLTGKPVEGNFYTKWLMRENTKRLLACLIFTTEAPPENMKIIQDHIRSATDNQIMEYVQSASVFSQYSKIAMLCTLRPLPEEVSEDINRYLKGARESEIEEVRKKCGLER